MARRASGIAVLFFLLAVVAGFGDGQRKVANALGLLVTVGYVATENKAFVALGQYFAGSSDKSQATGPGVGAAPTPTGQEPSPIGTMIPSPVGVAPTPTGAIPQPLGEA